MAGAAHCQHSGQTPRQKRPQKHLPGHCHPVHFPAWDCLACVLLIDSSLCSLSALTPHGIQVPGARDLAAPSRASTGTSSKGPPLAQQLLKPPGGRCRAETKRSLGQSQGTLRLTAGGGGGPAGSSPAGAGRRWGLKSKGHSERKGTESLQTSLQEFGGNRTRGGVPARCASRG